MADKSLTISSPRRARLGSYGKMVHLLEECERCWGTSVCGKWAGLARFTNEDCDCRWCIQAVRDNGNRK